MLDAIASWASDNGVEVGQVRVEGQTRVVADAVEPDDCELLVAVGGDGTTLAALREGAAGARPVLGLACGSVGDGKPEPLDISVEGPLLSGSRAGASVP